MQSGVTFGLLVAGPLTLRPADATYPVENPWFERTSMTYRFAFALITVLAVPVMASPVFAAKLYGAIAFSPSTGKFGQGHDFASKDEASTEAVSQCGEGDCEAVVVFPNCGAVAVGDGFGMGFSADKSVAKSEETALANCNQYTTNCLITTSFCNEGS